MRNQAPLNSCETGSCTTGTKHCSPCIKRMMIIIPLILIITLGYFAYSYFSLPELKPHAVVNTDTQEIDKETTSVNTETTAQYQDYSENTYNELLGEKQMVLFFHSNWCSWCRRMDKDINEQITSFPKNSVILKVNFDKENELRKKYEVLMKDTYVFIDSKGEEITTKPNASIDDLKNFFLSNIVSDEKVENPTGIAMYRDYDSEIEETFKGKKKYAIFFHADWCPQCNKLNKEIEDNFDNFSSSVAIFRADYDNELELRKQYGITMQHTLLFFDANGEVQEKIPGFTIQDINKVFNN